MRHAVLSVSLLSLTAGSPGWAQTPVPAEIQAAIVVRVLSYDRAFSTRHGSVVKLGLLVKSGDASSGNREVVQAFSALKGRTIQGLPVSVTARAYQGPEDLAEWIGREKLAALHVSPGLADQFEAIGQVCRRHGIISSSSVREFAKGGVLSVVLEADAPKLLINVAMAQQLGMDLDPRVLEASEQVR